MHIVIVGPFPPYRGGIAHFNERLASSLQKSGTKVTAINFSFQYPSLFFPGTVQTEETGKNLPFPCLRLVSSVNPLSWWLTARRINSMNPDVVIFRYWIPFMSPALSVIARNLKANILRIAVTDNIVPHERRLGDRLLTRIFVDSMDGFVTLSGSVMSDLEGFDRKKPRISLFHPLYDQFGEKIEKGRARDMLGISRSDRVVLFFGFIRAYKGLDLLLEAMGSEKLRSLNVKLLIAGEFYEDSEVYEEIISKHGLQDRLIGHYRFIPSEDVAKYFCAADCIVQPYKSATQSGVTQIAYHFERPMIVTRVSGLPEIVPDGECGFITEPVASAVAESVYRFYDEKKEESFTAGVRKNKERFSWNRFNEALILWLNGILPGRGQQDRG